MTLFGFHASHEQIPPGALLTATRRAETVGFDAAMCSDHMVPWSARQGESGFAWSWLGAALEATSLSFGVVNAPGQRYHPAIIAQAAATLESMYPGRFWVALGSGEAANEHITGGGWPRKDLRNARLRECVDILRALFRGEEVSHDGLVTVDRARLWTLPENPPPLIAAAVSAETAGWAGEWADGLATIAQPIETLRRVTDAYRSAGGKGPLVLQMHLSYADTEAEALDIAHDQWRSNIFSPPLCWDIDSVEGFDEASRHVRPEDMRSAVFVSADPTAFVRQLREYADLGFDRIYLHHVGKEQDRFLDTFGEHVLPELQGGPRMKITDTSDLWWKSAVVYCLDVETFMDWNNDGTGDLPGLAARLDYLAELGVTCLWLMPFYPTPDHDDGYDVLDFYAVDPRLGSLGDLVEVIRTAKDRGMRVIADLVINHTSDQHPWFLSARSDRNSPHRDYYVWRDEPPKEQGEPVFPDEETSNWEYDKKTKQYYQHIFYKHQPDLNVTNPIVRDEIAKIMGFWLELGLSGFRVDAVPFLLETSAVVAGDDALPDPHDYLRTLRAFLGRRSGDGVLLGEVNLPRDEQATYFGGPEGDELTMQFDFISMQKLYLALARQDVLPLVEALMTRTGGSADSQWANFVRNHDELTLDKLSDDERQEVFAAFGPEERMQVFGRGLVRRLPPMLGGDPRRIRMVYSLLFSLPGTPVLFYGEEIGMGENLSQKGRMAVRTPMQWNAGTNGGFSAADPDELCSAVVEGGYGPQHVNVEQQRRDPDSLLNFIHSLVRHYRNAPEFGWGAFELLEQPHAAVLAHALSWDTGRVIALHNFGTESLEVPLTIEEAGEGTRLSDLLTGENVRVIDGTVDITLGGYGYRWLRVVHEPDTRQY